MLRWVATGMLCSFRRSILPERSQTRGQKLTFETNEKTLAPPLVSMFSGFLPLWQLLTSRMVGFSAALDFAMEDRGS